MTEKSHRKEKPRFGREKIEKAIVGTPRSVIHDARVTTAHEHSDWP